MYIENTIGHSLKENTLIVLYILLRFNQKNNKSKLIIKSLLLPK